MIAIRHHSVMGTQSKTRSSDVRTGVLQRKCTCGGSKGPSGECTECRKKRLLQPKLTVSQPGDKYEQEADRIAEQVMRLPISGASSASPLQIQRVEGMATSCNDVSGAQAPPMVHDVLNSPGQPLDPATRSFMEPRFGHDFSMVRVHANSKAARSAQAVQARAYTVGNNVVFGSGEYTPNSKSGYQLLAHELTHVVQQTVGIRGLQRHVIVEPNKAAANDILSQFNFLCPTGNFSLNGREITSDCTSRDNSCDCLCDVTTDSKRLYAIKVHNVSNSAKSQKLHDGTTATIPMPSPTGPNTHGGTDPTINMASTTGSSLVFGFFKPNGGAELYDNWRILAHELCGHARLNQTYSGGKGNRAGHNKTIKTENKIAGEHGGTARGLFGSPRQGESFHSEPISNAKFVFALKNGWHFEQVP